MAVLVLMARVAGQLPVRVLLSIAALLALSLTGFTVVTGQVLVILRPQQAMCVPLAHRAMNLLGLRNAAT